MWRVYVGLAREKTMWHDSGARWLPIRTLFATLPGVKVANVTCLLTSANERDVFFWVFQHKIIIWDEETQKNHLGNTRGQSERYLLHFSDMS